MHQDDKRERGARERPLNRLEEEIQQLKKQLYDIQVTASTKNLMDLDEVESPFTEEILRAPLPPKFTMPQFPPYD